MSIKDDINRFRQGWQTFWFAPASPVPMALFRIGLGLVVIQCLVVHLLADWHLYYGDYAIVPIEDMISKYWRGDPYFDLMLLLPPGEEWRWYFFWMTAVFAFMMTVGLFTRVSAVLTFLCLMSLQHHFLINQNAGDNYLRIATMCVAFSNAGDALSLDSLIKGIRQDWRVTGFLAPLSSPWAQRLLQVQICLAYYHTWVAKMAGETWFNKGTAVYFATRYDDVMRFPLPFILDNYYCIQILTWGTLVVEFALWSLIWFRATRYWVMLAGLGLHLGIEYCMNLPMFEWLFMLTYFLFIYPEDLDRFWRGVVAFVHKHIARPSKLMFDGSCIVCVRTVGLIHRLDIFKLVDLIDFRTATTSELGLEPASRDRLESEILLATPSGKVLGGFQAFRYMTGRLPLLLALFPLLYLPIVAQLGELVYKTFAANRFKILGGRCPQGVCQKATSS